MKYQFPNLRNLKAFEAAARHQNFYQAADELNCTASEIDFLVTQLEKQLGSKLFIRGIGHVTLTQNAHDYSAYVAEAFEILTHATSRLKKPRKQPPLSISLCLHFLNTYLMQELGDFYLKNPAVHLRLMPDQNQYQDSKAEADLIIKYCATEPKDARSFEIYELMKINFIPVCAPAYLLDKAELKKPKDIGYFKLLHHQNTPDAWKIWCEQQDLLATDYIQGLYFQNQDDLLKAALEGKGIALMTPAAVELHLASGALTAPFPLPAPGAAGYYLFIPQARLRDPQILHMRDWLLAKFGTKMAQTLRKSTIRSLPLPRNI